MKLKKFVLWVGLLIATSMTGSAKTAVIPMPVEISTTDGEFRFPSTVTYSAPETVSKIFEKIIPSMQQLTGSEFVASSENQNATLKIDFDPTLSNEEYKMDITPDCISITASEPAGFFYAFQTLSQLAADKSGAMQCMVIKDKPRFGWRGFMLDEGRHIFGKDEVKKVLDIMALYKMNRFHWHLTEDQGWRIEIKKYPLLTETGAFRSSRGLGWKNSMLDSISYGGYYTQDDIKEIVEYAKDRFIEIVPEIDIPGHSQAAIAAYPEILACDPENKHEVWLNQGVSRDVINVANPQAVQMAKDIIDELVELFPFPYLHLGGDECPTDKWEKNEQCRSLLAELGSENYRDLQLNFYKELAAHLDSKQPEQRRKLIFWNEAQHGNTSMLPDDITIMAWVQADAEAQKAAATGFNTILSPQIPYYINRKQSAAPDEPLSQGNGSETLQAVYNYIPLKDVPEELHSKYMGVQANFWSEYVITPEFLEYLILPRLTAVAEAGWTPQENRNYTDFLERIKQHKPLFEANGWNYCNHEL